MITMKKNKFNIKNMKSYQVYNLIAVLICSFFVVSLSIGYSILSKDLNIDGTISLRTEREIRVTAYGNMESLHEGGENYSTKYNEDSITSSVFLPNLDSTVTYTGEITNFSEKTKTITNIEVNNSNDLINYEIESAYIGTEIAPGSKLTFKVTFKYKTPISEIPSNIDLNSVIKFSFADKIESEKTYIEDGKLLDLRGIDAPVSNTWPDKGLGKTVNLTNVSYDATNKSYVFNGSSYGKISEAMIPETGDFTLEVLATYPDNIGTIKDQAVVSQTDDNDSNDFGRFKVGFQINNGQFKILSFLNNTAENTNELIYPLSNAVSGTKYNIQLIRKGDSFITYINNNLTSQKTISADAKISQKNFKLGTWTSSTTQYYTGSMNAVRLYNRALTENELKNNYELDNVYYNNEAPEITAATLDEYIRKYQQISVSVAKDNLNNYVYRGVSPSNYLKFSGSNNLYRIISLGSDNVLKIIDTTNLYNGSFDATGNRDFLTSTYCNQSSNIAEASDTYGCNIWDARNSYTGAGITGNIQNDSTINSYLNSTYYTSLPENIKSKVLTHAFAVGTVIYNTTRDDQNIKSYVNTWTGKIGLPTVADIINASTNGATVVSTQTTISDSWLALLPKSNYYYWTMTNTPLNTYDVEIIMPGGTLAHRRASRKVQGTFGFYATPSFYVNGNVSFQGTGTEVDPFVI